MRLRKEGNLQAGRLWIASGWVTVLMCPQGNACWKQGDGEYAQTPDSCVLFASLLSSVLRLEGEGAMAWLWLPFSGSPLALHEGLSFGTHSVLPGRQ